MSGLNDTNYSNQNDVNSGWLRCANVTANGTEPPCLANGTGHRSQLHRTIKTFHMRKGYRNPTDLYVGPYDPANGIRTACILGSFLLFVTVYIIYKAKCGKNRWTSADRLFIEKYKQRLAEKEFAQKASRRKSFHEVHAKQEIAVLEATARWIQSQPLDLVPTRKKQKQGNACNVCLQALDTPSCPTCSKSQSRVSMETSCPADTTWLLNSQKQPSQEKLGLVSLALNSTKDVVQVPLYKNPQYSKNDDKDRQRWNNNVLRESCHLDGKLKKYSNVEYLNLHMNSPESENKNARSDQKCIKMDVAKLLGAKSYEYMAKDSGDTARGNGKEMIPLLQTRREDSQTSRRSSSNDMSGCETGNTQPTARDMLGARKSDGYLHPPYHHGSLPTYKLAAVPSPHLLSPYHRPDVSASHMSSFRSLRPKRSTLSLNLPNPLATDRVQPSYNTPPHAYTVEQTSSADQLHHPVSSWSLRRASSHGQQASIESGASGSTDDATGPRLLTVNNDHVHITIDDDQCSEHQQSNYDDQTTSTESNK